MLKIIKYWFEKGITIKKAVCSFLLYFDRNEKRVSFWFSIFSFFILVILTWKVAELPLKEPELKAKAYFKNINDVNERAQWQNESIKDTSRCWVDTFVCLAISNESNIVARSQNRDPSCEIIIDMDYPIKLWWIIVESEPKRWSLDTLFDKSKSQKERYCINYYNPIFTSDTVFIDIGFARSWDYKRNLSPDIISNKINITVLSPQNIRTKPLRNIKPEI